MLDEGLFQSIQSSVSIHIASIRSSAEAMDQSSSTGSGAPFRMTLELICLLRESSDMLEVALLNTGESLDGVWIVLDEIN